MARLLVEVTQKGISTTTRALDGLSKKAKTTEVSVNQVKTAVKRIGAAATVASGSVIAFTAAMTANTNELNKNAYAAGLTTKEFQDMALAASTVGVNADQLGAILGDTSEKIGDFLATGGGGFQDFADVMGYTAEEAREFAEELEGLSGRDVLVRMTERMEDAGVSAKQMNFALEGMASDARNLIPLLNNSASSLKTLEGRFGSLATTIDEETVHNLNELNTVTKVVASNMANTLAKELSGVSEWLIKAGENAAFFWSSLQKGTQQEALSNMASLADSMRVINREIETLESGESWMEGIFSDESIDAQIDKRVERVKQLQAEYDKFKQQYLSAAGLTTPTAGSSEPLELTITPEVVESELSQWQKLYGGIDKISEESVNKRIAEIEALEEREALMRASIVDAGQALSGSLSSGINGLIDGSKTAKEALLGVVTSVTSSIIQSGIDILVQKYITDNILKALNLQTVTSQVAQNTALAAQAAYVSAVATPIVGPAIAPAAATAAATAAGAIGAPAIAAASARQQGGQVNAGDSVLVGERSAELFVPNTSGRILNKQQIEQQIGGFSGGGNITINNYSTAKVSAEQDDLGNTYVKIEDFSGLMASEGSNPDSEFNQAQDRVYTRQRA